jgi:hypothetical protein
MAAPACTRPISLVGRCSVSQRHKELTRFSWFENLVSHIWASNPVNTA